MNRMSCMSGFYHRDTEYAEATPANRSQYSERRTVLQDFQIIQRRKIEEDRSICPKASRLLHNETPKRVELGEHHYGRSEHCEKHEYIELVLAARIPQRRSHPRDMDEPN